MRGGGVKGVVEMTQNNLLEPFKGGGVKGVVEMAQSNLLEPFKTLEIHHALYFYL